MARSLAQTERQRTRKRGRYSKGPVCCICGKSAGFDYWTSATQKFHPHCARPKCVAYAEKNDPQPKEA